MASTAHKPGRRTGPVANLVELVVTVAIAIGIAFLVQALLVKPYKIPSGSMIPALAIGQRILVNRLDTHPGLGDTVVFHPPAGADPSPARCGNPGQGPGNPQPCDRPTAAESPQTFVKRVVGLPGDHLRISDGHVWRNGTRETFGYNPAADSRIPGFVACTTTSLGCTFSESITVPAGHYFMMGDNRGVSDDSRFWGPVPQKWIIGVAFATYWPINRIGIF